MTWPLEGLEAKRVYSSFIKGYATLPVRIAA
jgi:hypothetical protein